MKNRFSVLKTTDSGLKCVTTLLGRVRKLAIQAFNETLTEDKKVAHKEPNQLMSSINDSANNFAFYTVELPGDIHLLFIHVDSI